MTGAMVALPRKDSSSERARTAVIANLAMMVEAANEQVWGAAWWWACAPGVPSSRAAAAAACCPGGEQSRSSCPETAPAARAPRACMRRSPGAAAGRLPPSTAQHLRLAARPPRWPQVLPAVYLFVGASLNATPSQLGTLTLCRALVQTMSSPLSGACRHPTGALPLTAAAAAALLQGRSAQSTVLGTALVLRQPPAPPAPPTHPHAS